MYIHTHIFLRTAVPQSGTVNPPTNNVCMYMYVYIYIYIHNTVCMYTCMCIYIYIYIYEVNPQTKNIDIRWVSLRRTLKSQG